MYLPFLRGKQFELIALRELSPIFKENYKIVSPVIEPVKDSDTGLKKAIEVLSAMGINFNIIINPTVGDLRGETDVILQTIKSAVHGYENFQIGLNISNESSLKNCLEIVKKIDFEFNGFSLIHNTSLDNISEIQNSLSSVKPIIYNLINYNGTTSRRYHRNFPEETRVLLDDYFISLEKNSDYKQNIDEPFTEDHLYFKEDGFTGFSDYLTIGSGYSEGGFLPYAIVIHLTYFDVASKLRIHHFVSDSNQDSSDIGGKFAEALNKLIDWINANRGINTDTSAIKDFEELHKRGHFPGLGVVKKLSIKHHIELLLKNLQ